MASNVPNEIDHTSVCAPYRGGKLKAGLETTGLRQEIKNDLLRLGRRFAIFLKNCGRAIVGKPSILLVERSVAFDPVSFVGKQGWSIATKETNIRVASLKTLCPARVRIKSMLKFGEQAITGEERLRRIRASERIRLDVNMFQALWGNQHLIPENWKEGVDGSDRYIYFDGTVFQSPLGERYVLCLYWHKGEWCKTFDWLGRESADSYSAVL